MSEIGRLLENEGIEVSLSDDSEENRQIIYDILKAKGIIKEDFDSVVERKGILDISEGKNNSIETLVEDYKEDSSYVLLKDIVSRQLPLKDISFMTDTLYSMFEVDEKSSKNENEYKNYKIILNGYEYDAHLLLEELIEKDKLKPFEGIGKRISEHVLSEGIYKTLNFLNNEYIESEEVRKGGNGAFVHPLRTAVYLKSKGFGELEQHLALLHDYKEDMLKELQQKIKIKEKDIQDMGNSIPELWFKLNNKLELRYLKNKLKKKESEIDEKIDILYHAEYSGLEELPILMNILTNNFNEEDLPKDVVSKEDKKIKIYEIYSEDIINHAENYIKEGKENIAKAIITVKIAEAYNNTIYLDEAGKEVIDRRFKKNYEFLKRTIDFVKNNKIVDERVYEVIDDFINLNLEQINKQYRIYSERKIKTNPNFEEGKWAKRFRKEYREMKEDFKEELTKLNDYLGK